MNILVVEDESKLANYLKKGLSESGFNVDLASDGREGLAMASTGGYDAVVLDIMLPIMDGFAVLRELRQRSQVPVLMLTARDEVEDRVRGLETGADDYLAKPFAFSELVARVRALLRRGPGQETNRFVLADLQIDLITRRATRAGVRLDLTPKEFCRACCLSSMKGEA